MNALAALFGIVMFLTALFLILLVLVQRGRGGGLSGALGGMGGQSAFGTKAGDLFTKITMYVATFWILLCMVTILVLNPQKIPQTGSKSETAEFTTTAPVSKDKSDTQSGASKNTDKIQENVTKVAGPDTPTKSSESGTAPVDTPKKE